MEPRKSSVVLPYKCEACAGGFKRLSSLQKHRIKEHLKNPSTVDETLASLQDNLQKTERNKKQGSRKGYECGICRRFYTVLEELLNHLDIHRAAKLKDVRIMKLLALRAKSPKIRNKQNVLVARKICATTKDGNDPVVTGNPANASDPAVLKKTSFKSTSGAKRSQNDDVKFELLVRDASSTAGSINTTREPNRPIRDPVDTSNLKRVKNREKLSSLGDGKQLRGTVKNVKRRGKKKKINKRVEELKNVGSRKTEHVKDDKNHPRSSAKTTHEKSVSDSKIPVCDENEVSRSSDGLKTKQCQFCKKLYSTVRRLKEHLKAVHRRNGEFICDVCCRVFSTAFNLRRHASLHVTDTTISSSGSS